MFILFSPVNRISINLLLCFIVVVHLTGCAQKLHLKIDEDRALFKEANNSVLVYQIKPKSLQGEFERSNYIHPLYTLDGLPITEDFPKDHLHHRGIFWAWHQLYINEDRIGDAWEIKDFEWEVENSMMIKNAHGAATLKSTVFWKSNLITDENGENRPLVEEINQITVFPKEKDYRLVDIVVEMRGLFDNVSIGGSEDEKGYGGFSARIELSEDVVFKDSRGNVTPQNTPVQGNDWINIISKTPENGKPYGLAIIPSKDNPDYPNPWILRSKESMQNAVYPYPGSIPIGLSRESPLVLMYRLVIHDGQMNKSTLTKLQNDYFSEN